MNMTEKCAHDQKHHTDKQFFGHIHPFKFVVLMNLFHLYFFGHIHRFFGQVQQLMFVGVIFWSCSNVHVHQ